MQLEEAQYKKMIDTPVKRLVLSLGIPTMISMLVSAIYNLADTYFVANLATETAAAVSDVFPFQAIIQAIGFTLGMGGGSYISSLLGQKKNDEAQKVGSSSFYMSLILGIIVTILGLIFMKPILLLLGAKGTVYDYAAKYAVFIIIGSPIMAGSFVLNNLLRAEGKARFAMIGLTSGGILNIILDPIFIHVFKMGIQGASLATLISQCVSFTILLMMFIFKKSILRLSPLNMSLKFSLYAEVVKIGLPSFCRQGLASLATILLNNAAFNAGGAAAQSAMGIVNKIFLMIFSACLGIGQGYQPVCGYNYFAGYYKRVKEAAFFTLSLCSLMLVTISLVVFLDAERLMSLFNPEPEIVSVGKIALRYQCIAMPIVGLNTICNMTYQSMRLKLKATILSLCRQGIFFIPLVLILPNVFGLKGVQLTQPIADVLTATFSIPFFISIIKKLNKESEVEKIEID